MIAQYKPLCIYLKIKKVGVFRKVLNKQFIEKLRAIFIINKTQLHISTDCFTHCRNHQVDLDLHNKTLKRLPTI